MSAVGNAKASAFLLGASENSVAEMKVFNATVCLKLPAPLREFDDMTSQ